MPELARKISALPWVSDGIEGVWEHLAIRGLLFLADEGHTENLIELPWVAEGRNHLALYSLSSIASGLPAEFFDRIVSHPTVSDGITDQEAKVITVLVPSAVLNPDLSDKLLDLEQVSLEERTITLPLAGETELTIIRTRPGTDYAMDSLERAVPSIEEFMGLPFPGLPVIIWFEEGPYQTQAAKVSTHVSVLADEQTMSEERMRSVVAHEASHYYWGYDTQWVSEGAATFMESIVMNAPYGPLRRPPCARARSIAEFEDLGRDPTSWDVCPYSLGERLFRDLYRNMDDTTFRLAFRRLHLHTVLDVTGDECMTGETTICHVREAFSTYASGDMAAAVEKVIARWHDGTEPYDLSWIDDSPVEADIAAIDGRIEGAHLSLSKGGPPVSAVTVEPDQISSIYLNLDYSYRKSGGLDSLPIEISLYFEDGFEFRRIQTELPLPNSRTRRTHHIWMRQEGAPGRYWVHAYWGEQKIAEATFEVVPDVDRRNIRGVVTGTEGLPIEIALSANDGEERFRVETGKTGVFNVEVPFGSYILEVNVLVGSEWRPVGWYDGSGGITTDPSQAFEVVVDSAGVDTIVIALPAIPEASIRGVVIGPDGRPRRETILLAILREGKQVGLESVRGGSFDVVVPTGSYVLEVRADFGSAWRTVGWYDGSGGMTTVRSQASEVIVYGADVEGIEIRFPSADYHSIKGTVTGGPSPGSVGLMAKQDDIRAWVEAGPGGAFYVAMFPGSYILEVHLQVGSEWHFVGWYDGSGGITTDPSRAFEVIVAGADVEGIEIRLPTDT